MNIHWLVGMYNSLLFVQCSVVEIIYVIINLRLLLSVQHVQDITNRHVREATGRNEQFYRIGTNSDTNVGTNA